MHKPTAVDAFNMLCGEKIGSGSSRDVFECKLRPDLVAKVEVASNGYRSFANAAEMRFWDNFALAPDIARWLAACEYMSPDGYILLQERVTPATEHDMKRLPKTLPAFLTDRKFGNFGWNKKGRLVCMDYAITINNPSLRQTKAEWW